MTFEPEVKITERQKEVQKDFDTSLFVNMHTALLTQTEAFYATVRGKICMRRVGQCVRR